MNKTYLLRCWSDNPEYNAGFDMALVEVNGALREKAWIIRKLCDRFIQGMNTESPIHISFEASFFSNEPVFLEAPDEEEEALSDAYEKLEDGADSVQLPSGPSRDLEGRSKWDGGCRIHAGREGLYWTTYPRQGDILITTSTLTWENLGVL